MIAKAGKFVLSLFGKGTDEFEGYTSNHKASDAYLPQISIQDFQDGKRRFGDKENTTIVEATQEGLTNVSSRLGFTTSNNAQQRSRRLDEKRWSIGLYANHPLANDLLKDSKPREIALKRAADKQLNHVRGTDGWWRTMLVIEDRAMDNYLGAWLIIILNAFVACLLSVVYEVQLPEETLEQWDTAFSLVLKTSLAFLLVFRMNRTAHRFWEARGYWGNLAHLTRNLVGKLLQYGTHNPTSRDLAIQWGSSFCLASKYFIRSQKTYNVDEFAGFLNANQVKRLEGANHAALLSASMCRFYLDLLFPVDADTPPGLAHLYALRLQECEAIVARMVEQVSGMEKIRSTPLPIVYVSHLRTFLFVYLMVLPYSWVTEWAWSTIPLVAFTSFALLGIEGGSSEVEIPFSQHRPNHLALDAYCLVILDSVMGLVVQDANLHMQGRKTSNYSKSPKSSRPGLGSVESKRDVTGGSYKESKRDLSGLKRITSVESVRDLGNQQHRFDEKDEETSNETEECIVFDKV